MPSFHWRMSWSVQKRASFVCSGVLLVLSMRPRSLTWLKSSAYSWLVSAFGPSGRNCERASSASGRIPGRQSPSTGSAALGCHTPGPGAGGPRSDERGAAATAVVRAQREHGSRDLLTDRDPVCLAAAPPVPSGMAAM